MSGPAQKGLAIVTLSREGAQLAAALARALGPAEVFVHASAVESDPAGPAGAFRTFDSIAALTGELFDRVGGLVYVVPTGVAVRAIAPHVRDKRADPAVVVVDAGGRWAISLLSGHEGGANDLALRAANALGAEPVVSTTTEALKTLIVGVGCRRGTAAGRIVQAVRAALAAAGAGLEQVRLLASVDLKADEPGLLEAAATLGLPLRLVPADEICSTCRGDFAESATAREKLNLPAAAEPSALLAGRRTRLLLPRQIVDGVTVAVAREDCMWSD